MTDTTLDLHDGNGALVASNDNWRAEQEQEVIDTAIPPGDGRESAIVRTLQPGNYTAIVRGKDGASVWLSSRFTTSTSSNRFLRAVCGAAAM